MGLLFREAFICALSDNAGAPCSTVELVPGPDFKEQDDILLWFQFHFFLV